MTTLELLSASPLEIFEWATNVSKDEALKIVLKSAFFIDPEIVRQTPVQYPNHVRESREWHPEKRKGEDSTWEGRPVRVCDNTQARIAFGRYIGMRMGGANRDVSIGWEVAHIWGRVFDPDYFTAGWNMLLIPGFLRVLTEEQAKIPLFSKCFQTLAYRLFFEGRPVATPKLKPTLDNTTHLPSWVQDFSPRLLRAEELKAAPEIDVDALPEHLRKLAQNL